MSHSGGVRGDDGLPPIELIEDSSEVRSEATIESGRRRGWRSGVLAVALGAAVLAVIVMDLVDDPSVDDPAGVDDPAEPATTDPADGPSAPSGTYLMGIERPVFERAIEASVLVGSLQLEWRLVDLATGWARDVPDLDGMHPQHLWPVRGGVMVLQEPFEELSMLRLDPEGGDPAGDIERFERRRILSDETVELLDVVSAGTGDAVWVLSTPRRSRDTVQASLIDVEGARLVGPFDLPVRPVAGTASGLVYNAGGRSYLVGPDGIDDLGSGMAYEASASKVARVACDETARCVQEVVDLVTGEVWRGAGVSTTEASQGSITMALSQDGLLATIMTVLPEPPPVTGTREPATNLYLADAAGPPRGIVVKRPRDGPAWLPDGGVLMLTGDGLVRYSEVDGRLVAETAEGIRPEGAAAIVVIPR